MKEKLLKEIEKRDSIFRKYGGWRKAGFDGIRIYPDLALAVDLLLLYKTIEEETNKETRLAGEEILQLVALEDEQMSEFQKILASVGFDDSSVKMEFC